MKFSLLVHLLKHEHAGLVMVFCNTRSNTDFVANNLKENGIEAEAIHGGLTQDRRSRIMDMFHAKNVYVLVCTDVAARGLDIPGVSHVYNYDMPSESKQYIHRIGRTARAGAEGRAVSILSQRDYDNFRFVLRDYEVDVEKQDLPEIEHARIGWRHEPRSGYGRGGPGGRSSGYGRGGGGRSYGHSSGPRSGGYGGGRPYSDRPRSSSIGQRSRGFPKKRESGDHNMRNY
jgi:ATP-dependent RNA helicase DeaD